MSRVFVLSSDWFIVLFGSVVIGHSYFFVDFTTLNCSVEDELISPCLVKGCRLEVHSCFWKRFKYGD